MKFVLSLVVLAVLYGAGESKPPSPPKVVVYSRDPGEYGKPNHFICHVNNFHPPDIKIELLKGDEELPDSEQTDLAFKQDWHFHLTKSAPFTPKAGEKVACRVTHNGVPKIYEWEPNM